MLRPSAIVAGSLAFLGPPHAPELTRYVYARVRSVDRHAATVVVVGPGVDDTESLEVPLASMRYRIVDEAEAVLWPGAYVSVPVAFVQPKGQDAGLWAYGVVVSYRTGSDGPMLDVLHDQEMIVFPLHNDDRIIKVDYLNFALRVDQGASVSATNPSELLAKQNSIIAACAKRRGSLPASVLELLNQPINDLDVVTLVRPSTLERVRVRRQHIIKVSLQSSKKRAGSMFDDPDVPSHSHPVVNPASAPMEVAPLVSGMDERLDDDGSSSDASFSRDDMAAVQQQNVTLGKRRRRLSSSSSSTSPSVVLLDERPRQASKGLFQPSTTSRRANGLVAHSRHQGKDPHSLLELIQRSGHVVLFLAVPPVPRALFDFAFGDRGLDVMHCKRATMADKVLAKEKGINMMDFSDKNILRAPGKARNRSDVADALRVLAVFARFFYNSQVNELIATAAAFVDAYTGIEENCGEVGCKLEDEMRPLSSAQGVTQKSAQERCGTA